jgi:hypothetical protein
LELCLPGRWLALRGADSRLIRIFAGAGSRLRLPAFPRKLRMNMSNSTEALGRCPVCGYRITPLQAAWYGAGKSFVCRSCGSSLAKVSSRYFVAAPLIVITLFVFRSHGMNDPLSWLVFAIGCLMVTLDALLFGRVRLVKAALK